MDPKTSSQSMSARHEVGSDVDNLIDRFADLVCKKEVASHGDPIVIYGLDVTHKNSQVNEICQIAAWCRGNVFNQFMLPENGIHWAPVRGQHVYEIEGGTLRLYGNVVNTLPPREGLLEFLDFLRTRTGQTRGVYLAGHNCSQSLRHIIVRLMRKYELFDTFQSLVLGFTDTIAVFKTILPERAQEGGKFSLKKLATDILGLTFPAQPHAVVNLEILLAIINAIECTDAMLALHAQYVPDFGRYFDLRLALGDLLTPFMLHKIANALISIETLKNEYRANGSRGVSRLLREHQISNQAIENINARLPELLNDGNAS